MRVNYIKRLSLLAICTTLLSSPAFTQDAGSDTLTQLLNYSHPAEGHQKLATLTGTWQFQDVKRSYVKGILVRKAIFDGRFYTVEITGGKLPLPVSNGEMREDNYKSLQWEGYDNVRRAYFTTSINNHIGTDEEYQQGLYDSTANSISYESDSELLPGFRVRNRRVLHFVDASNYTEEYFERSGSEWNKTRELRYWREQKKTPEK